MQLKRSFILIYDLHEVVLKSFPLHSPLDNRDKMTPKRNAILRYVYKNNIRYLHKLSKAELGPLHMSPVNRAGSVSEISPRFSFLRKNFDVFI